MKNKIILLVIATVVLIGFVYFYKYAGCMVSQDIKNVENITIATYPYDINKVIIDNKEEINKIFDILSETTEITNYRYPSHVESIQHDPQFTIDIEYTDGKKDRIFASGGKSYIGRFLNSKGTSGDPGYRIGKNQMIWEYALQYFPNQS